MPAQKRRRFLPEPTPEPDPVYLPTTYHSGSSLAKRLMAVERIRPAVVVSYTHDAGSHRIDAAELAQMLGDEADVFEIANGAETRKLEEGLPPGLQIFGTGARLYPAGADFPAIAPEPHVVRGPSNLGRLAEQLLSEIRSAAHTPAPTAATAPKPATVTATGYVSGFASEDNSRALVKLVTTGKLVTVRAEDLLPGVPLDWLLKPGQLVTGVLSSDTWILDIHGSLLKQPSPITVYNNGDVALARVRSTNPTHALVTLWPGAEFRIGVERISSNELDSAEDLLTEGEVVRTRVLYESGTVVLSMLDVDDDEPLAGAPALVAGGPPWLDPDRPYASIFAPPAQPAAQETGPGTTGEAGGTATNGASEGPDVALPGQEPALTPAERKTALKSTQMELEKARHTITELLAAANKRGATDKIARALQDQLEDARKEANELARQWHDAQHQADVLRAELAKTKAKLVGAKQQRRSVASRTESSAAGLFMAADQQFGYELTAEWAKRVPASDKAAEPLGDYVIGPQFLASVALLTSAQRTKTLRAVVDLAAARPGPLHNRKPHLLRENEGAHAPARTRGEDICMRLAVEQGTAGALRLHYWKLKAGGIELHEVVTHDEVKP
ncbi:hypothetical protein [Arthrobacter sp. GMC3]|uniref:hypothetical protein n=1 Tax=Arthrobacter sp. GMC3 TaxID=2058894 RepID=UPI000CE44DBE|nr:hypothetical protein [Arthrobacter sp. GMC3]